MATNPKANREVRYLGIGGNGRGLELRASETGDGPGTIVGYAAVYNSMSEDLGGFREKLAPGVFTRSLLKNDVRALAHHDTSTILGRASAKTLRLREDANGLLIECDLPDTTAGRDAAVSVARRDITGMSFAFMANEEIWDWTEDPVIRTVTDAELFEVSIVGWPAYPDTSVAMRSLEKAREKRTTPPEPTPQPAASPEPEPKPAEAERDWERLFTEASLF